MIGEMTSKSVPQIQPLTRARKKSQRSPKEVRIIFINVATPEGKLFFNLFGQTSPRLYFLKVVCSNLFMGIEIDFYFWTAHCDL